MNPLWRHSLHVLVFLSALYVFARADEITSLSLSPTMLHSIACVLRTTRF